MESDISRIISFWFNGPEAPSRWFRPPPGFDDEIRENFESLIQQARNHELDAWTANPRSCLALILLLDQFPRNIYRGSDEAHVCDAQACGIAVQAIGQEFDRQVDDLQAHFFYLPLMHDETLISQIGCVALAESLAARCPPDSAAQAFATKSVAFAKGHRDVIVKFGRFPSRNKILGRESTAEEVAFLKEHPGGFF